MRKTVLYLCMSLDGYVSENMDALEWLRQIRDEQGDSVFLKDVDTVVMDWNSYYHIATELSPGEWAHPNVQTYVLTDRQMHETHDIHFSNQNPANLLQELRDETGKDIWVFGDAPVLRQVMKHQLFDELVISVKPSLQGKGTHLFESIGVRKKLQLLSSADRNGILRLHYSTI